MLLCYTDNMNTENEGKILSVHQPFAWLIVNGVKQIEYRSWGTRYRGRLLIHACGKAPKDALQSVSIALLEIGDPPLESDEIDDVTRTGAIIGTVDLIDCKLVDGEYCWILENPCMIEPVPWSGRLGLTPAPDNLHVVYLDSDTQNNVTQRD